ncbi:RadC-like JAB domain-containing protein [Pedobacter terrae]|uniref:RadC-like JAB domain-containing protein n=1 Tax=Pedobacter terrae TaxID=405671 RepID=A0A1G7WJ99_9SPHI|nr:JAB domain-containing protein [Pedobacter terrae]SDG71944.1 RadC-like JAB domain-containing protein [Pedobacter terrae]
MQPTKNQIALAELKFSYEALNRPLDVSKAETSFNLLKQLRSRPLSKDKVEWYIMFVNENHQVFSWYELTKQKQNPSYVKQIGGLAIACNAYGILILNYCDIIRVDANELDERFLKSCFNTCEELKIEIIDYMICSPQSYLSLRESYKD